MVSVGIAGYAQEPGKAEPAAPNPEEVIRKFAEKEAQFFEAWKQYTYRQLADVRVLSVDGRPSNERMVIESEVVFDDSGKRDIQILRRSGGLRSVIWTPEDEKVIHDIQPFALTSAELPLYNVEFVGRQRVDELDCFAFSIKPKSIKKGRLYFEGRIWVDDRDYQIVRTMGKAVPQTADSQFPEFETIRQIVDKEYWFPAWTHADSILRFRAGRIRIEETITYEDYKRFGSKATIDFGPAKPPE
jgi:hypothetical protein